MTLATRGTTNRNARGSSYNRAARRQWLVDTYRANVDMIEVTRHYVGHVERFTVPPYYEPPAVVAEGYRTERLDPYDNGGDQPHIRTDAEIVPACRCYRCGVLLTVDTVTVDRIIPGAKGGTYRRSNIRPACGPCNSETGGAVRSC